MNVVDKAIETQLKNIQTRTGKSLDALFAVLRKSGLTKHGELLALLKEELGMGHGDANAIVKAYARSKEAPAGGDASSSDDAVVDALYAGPKASLRPIHDKVMAAVAAFGDFEIAPKKTYLSLRRKKQFAMVGPATKTRVEVGLNMKDIEGTERLLALPPGGMCQFKVNLSDVKDVDRELLAWIKRAYDAAG
ncbi:MAG: DUF4287 domain-containing protein [Ignavibacteria bacterium]|nr:DUF4287 domain-containing protein [Ignavibacteria bacterium]